MNYVIPALLKKTITFRRLTARNVLRYHDFTWFLALRVTGGPRPKGGKKHE